jgi:hypothetical protein
MQKLHLVGFTADFDGLIFSPRKGAKSGSFVVPIDARLLKQIAEAERLRDGGSPSSSSGGAEVHRAGVPRLVRPESSLSPREMQDRIRAGWSLEEVAGEAGVDLDWVSRFAAPVLAEVRQVVEQARELIYDKPRVGLSALPLGASVRRNVVDRGVRIIDDDEFDDCWSAYELDDDSWVVRFAYLSRGRSQEAEWRLDLETDELQSRNRLASQLGHVPKGRARRAASVAPAPPKRTGGSARVIPPTPSPVPAPAAAPKKASGRKASAKKAAKKIAAKKVAARKAPAKATKAPAKPASRAAARKTVAKKAAPTRRATPRSSAGRKKASSRPAKKPAKGERAPELTELMHRPNTPPAPVRPAPPAPAMGSRSPRGPVPAGPPRIAVTPPIRSSAPARPPAEPASRGPLPPPPPAPVPPTVREAVSHPIGEVPEPPRPGAAAIDEATGIARIDSRRSWHADASGGGTNGAGSIGARPAVFRGDVTRAGADAPARRPRRTEPLRGR